MSSPFEPSKQYVKFFHIIADAFIPTQKVLKL